MMILMTTSRPTRTLPEIPTDELTRSVERLERKLAGRGRLTKLEALSLRMRKAELAKRA